MVSNPYITVPPALGLENLVISVWSQTGLGNVFSGILLENLVISVWSQTHADKRLVAVKLENLVISVWSQTTS